MIELLGALPTYGRDCGISTQIYQLFNGREGNQKDFFDNILRALSNLKAVYQWAPKKTIV
jgi:hypothetical protein